MWQSHKRGERNQTIYIFKTKEINDQRPRLKRGIMRKRTTIKTIVIILKTKTEG